MTSKMTQNIAQILKVRINGSRQQEALSQILAFVANSCLPAGRRGATVSKKLIIFTPNPEFLVAASRDQGFRRLLNQSDINIADGFGLIWSSRFLGQPLPERVSGADLVAKLLKIGSEKKWAVGIAGARVGNLKESQEQLSRLQTKYPGIKFTNLDAPQLKIENCKLKIVLACHGMGRQERWIMENKERIPAKVFLGIGGALDFLSGFARRAPFWMRETGLEWLWRALRRPGHWKRIFTAVVVFPWLVVREKFQLEFGI